ncbi:hypothetical protein [Zavarzinia compransoris]|uniref:DUF3617 domain-containing protein n=1 Tax=Zavarzinia compransoris TaxID=1264899 RepID=A0A317E3Q4_9PROT|nr:hypothetical protein [Zavarzinia compransoris]PWR19695.1 hypothetical protein DKG75_14605 [Zavarzinia compransoris]TDP43359.1 hypothetical protein DES42_11260 [Zavarzinia compransoris]
MRNRAALFLAALLVPAAAAAAEVQVEGRWVLDPALSLVTLTANNAASPAEAAQVVALFRDAEIRFKGGNAQISVGPLPVTCGWTWGEGREIRLTACKDKRQQPAPAGPVRLELGTDGALRYVEDGGSALAFKPAR